MLELYRQQRFAPSTAVLALAALLASACTFTNPWAKKQPRVFVPPVIAKPAPSKPEPPQPLPQPPEVAAADADVTVPEPANMPNVPAPAPPKPTRRAPVAAAPKTAPPPAPPADPPPPAPKPTQIFTAEQTRDYNRAIEESMDRVKKALSAVAAKTLNPEQTEIAERIRTFQRQAEEAREQDLVTAVSLARRADVLAQDLLARLN